MLPKTVASRSLPYSLGAVSAGLYAGASHPRPNTRAGSGGLSRGRQARAPHVSLQAVVAGNKHLKYFEGQIQALVHWRSEDSTRIYGRMDNMPGKRSREGLFHGHERKQLAQDRSSGVQGSKRDYSARRGQNGFTSHCRRLFTVMNASSLPRIDPVAYNDQDEIILPDVVRIASQINIDA